MTSHLKPSNSGSVVPNLHTRLDVQAPSRRRVGRGTTVPEDRLLSATPQVRKRTDPRRDPTKLTDTAMRPTPPSFDSDTAPAPPVRARRPNPGPTPPVELTVSTTDEASDTSRGRVLFLTFVTAILVMVLAVWLAAAVGQWWILIPVFAVDLIMTTAVTGVVVWMLADGANPAQAHLRSLTPVPGLARDPDTDEHAHEPAHAA